MVCATRATKCQFFFCRLSLIFITVIFTWQFDLNSWWHWKLWKLSTTIVGYFLPIWYKWLAKTFANNLTNWRSVLYQLATQNKWIRLSENGTHISCQTMMISNGNTLYHLWDIIDAKTWATWLICMESGDRSGDVFERVIQMNYCQAWAKLEPD